MKTQKIPAGAGLSQSSIGCCPREKPGGKKTKKYLKENKKGERGGKGKGRGDNKIPLGLTGEVFSNVTGNRTRGSVSYPRVLDLEEFTLCIRGQGR